jgi:6-phosphogluconolactonase (cycloisomerase 2 family)
VGAGVATLVMVSGAFAAIGDLVPQGCIDDNDTGPDACATSVDGLGGGAAPAVSPDGRSVYAVSFTDDSIVRFDRDPATGALTYQGCFDDEDTGTEAACPGVAGLDQPRGLAISPDGLSVYVTTQIDDAIVRFDRNPTTGALTYQGCVDDDDEGPDNCAASTDGMNGAIEVDVSVDNASVYVVTSGDHGVVTFNRAPNGALTPAGCFEDDDGGTDGACPKIEGLRGAAAVEVSPDDKSVYVASFEDDAIVRFDRAANGSLTPQGCIDESLMFEGPDNCATSTAGLDNAIGIAITPDNRSVYVAGNRGDALARFDRNTTTGALTAQGCFSDDEAGGDPLCVRVDGLDGIFHAVSSPGGATIYTSAQGDDAVARFDRDPATGALTPNGCIQDNDTGSDTCATATDGLGDAGWADLSPDGTSLYVGAGGDSAVTTFSRDAEAIPPPGGGDTTPPETTIKKKPKKKSKKPKAKLKFISSEPGSTFECALKGKGVKKKLKKFKPCDSGKVKYKKLKGGKKKFQVRAKDPAGNVDPTPAKAKWKVV